VGAAIPGKVERRGLGTLCKVKPLRSGCDADVGSAGRPLRLREGAASNSFCASPCEDLGRDFGGLDFGFSLAANEGGRPAFRDGFARTAAVARAVLAAAGIEDFLRIFLDIRLPFVAFDRSVSARPQGKLRRLGHAMAAVHFCRPRDMVTRDSTNYPSHVTC
jgi:hypothetical protein